MTKGRKEKKDKSKKKKKHKKKKSRRRSRSGSTSSSNSDSSDKTSSSSSSGDQFVLWSPSKRSKISADNARKLGQEKFRSRSELLTFAAKHPGALSGHFLTSVFERLHNELPRNMTDLRRTSVTQWSQKYSGLTEVRDQREVATLSLAVDLCSRGDLSALMDVLCQRILAVQQAKQKGGTWEKAMNIELVSGDGAAAAPSGMLRLLN